MAAYPNKNGTIKMIVKLAKQKKKKPHHTSEAHGHGHAVKHYGERGEPLYTYNEYENTSVMEHRLYVGSQKKKNEKNIASKCTEKGLSSGDDEATWNIT